MPRIKVRKGRASPMVMHKEEMKRKLQSRLKFLLRFLNADVESLNSVELLKLFLDFGVFIYGIHDFAALRRIAGEGMDVEPKRELVQERKYLKVCQDFFRFLLDGFLGDEVSPGGSHPRFDTMTVSYSIFIHNDKIRKLPIHPKLHLLVLDLPEHLHEDGEIGNLYRGMLADVFVNTLSPFPVSRTKICQRTDCGNYFFQKTTKSKGDFCSSRCQNWARANRWRQNHRDDYNKYHRDRRTKAKEDQVEVKCHSCRFHQSVGSINDIIQGVLPDVKKCPTCGGMLLHFIRTWENGKWVEGVPLGSFEWEEFLKDETLRRED